MNREKQSGLDAYADSYSAWFLQGGWALSVAWFVMLVFGGGVAYVMYMKLTMHLVLSIAVGFAVALGIGALYNTLAQRKKWPRARALDALLEATAWW